MIIDQIDTTTQYLLQILRCLDVSKELRRHSDKKVNIAAFVMIATSHRTKKTHRSDAKTLLQFWQMLL